MFDEVKEHDDEDDDDEEDTGDVDDDEPPPPLPKGIMLLLILFVFTICIWLVDKSIAEHTKKKISIFELGAGELYSI